MGKIIVAIDGLSGSGKSTSAKTVARELGYSYIDTGAMYRAVTLFFLNKRIDISDSNQVDFALGEISMDFRFNQLAERNEIYLNGTCVEDKIRSMEVNQRVSQVSALPAVRNALRSKQRQLGQQKGVVMDGRDIGTAIFPEAELKLFLTANVAVRARRRQSDFKSAGEEVSLKEIEENLEQRDFFDTTRKTSPLTKAPDAYEIDTSDITLQQQIEQILRLARKRISETQ